MPVAIDKESVRQNMQIAFDIGGEHILKQSKRALVEAGESTCAYLNKDGLKCAIGALIPDGHSVQDKVMPVTRLIHSGLISDIPVLQYNDPSFLNRLQLIHDLYSIRDWKSLLIELADEYQLDTTVLDKYKWNDSKAKYECAG